MKIAPFDSLVWGSLRLASIISYILSTDVKPSGTIICVDAFDDTCFVVDPPTTSNTADCSSTPTAWTDPAPSSANPPTTSNTADCSSTPIDQTDPAPSSVNPPTTSNTADCSSVLDVSTDFSIVSDNKLLLSATPSPEKVENESLGSVCELAQKLEDIAEHQAVILHSYQLMQNTQKSVLSTQNEILIRLSGLERVVQCTPQQQFQQEMSPS